MAEQFQTTPSSLLGLDDPYTRYCLDEAVYIWGRHVENELAKATEGAKTDESRKRKYNQAWNKIFNQEKEPGAEQQFRDPFDMMAKG